MDREPKISEIEKLIKHFRETNREHELLEVLAKHNISKEEPVEVVEEETHQFHPEAIYLNQLAKKEGLIKKTNRFIKSIIHLYKHNWLVRYGTYYFLIFFVIFALLNAPIIVSWFNTFKEEKSPQVVTVQELEGGAESDTAPLAPGEVIPAGSQVSIPKIGVKAPIIFLNTRDEKTIQANLVNGVVHYAGTANPGEVGNSFITGHSSNYWWIKGAYNYIFLNLNKLVVGDQAVVYHNGKKYVYTATEIKVVEPSDVSVLAQTETPTLTLMTCTPPGTNWKRLIVKMEQTSPKYTKPRLVTKQVTVNPTSLPSTDNNSLGAIFLKIMDYFENLFK